MEERFECPDAAEEIPLRDEHVQFQVALGRHRHGPRLQDSPVDRRPWIGRCRRGRQLFREEMVDDGRQEAFELVTHKDSVALRLESSTFLLKCSG